MVNCWMRLVNAVVVAGLVMVISLGLEVRELINATVDFHGLDKGGEMDDNKDDDGAIIGRRLMNLL